MVRYIRLSKKIKSMNVYTGILSRPAVSRFEQGLSDTTSDKLFDILSNLNVSLDEFYYIYSNFGHESDLFFLKQYSRAFYLGDLEALNKLEIYTKQKYNLNSQLKQLHYSALCNLTISYISDTPKDMESLNILKNYLLKCEEWTYYELVLFTNTLDFFPEELVLILYKRTKKKLKSFSQLKKYNNEMFSMILNVLIIFIKKNAISRSEFFLEELEANLSETNNQMYERTMLNFLKELISAMKVKQLNNQRINVIISMFDCLEMPLKANQCSSLVEIVRKNNQIK